MKKIAFIVMSLILTTSGMAMAYGSNSEGVLFDLGLMKLDTSDDGPTIGNGKSSNTYYDLKLGYIFPSGLYLGVIDANYSQDNATDSKRTAYGVSVGYHNAGWFIDGSYFIDGSLDTGGSITYKKASNLGVDFGYTAMMGSNFFMGLEGSYKSIIYKEVDNGGTSITQNNKQNELYPMILLGVMF